jgi:O-antigen ligase
MSIVNFIRYELYVLAFMLPFGFWPELLLVFSVATYIGLISVFFILAFPDKFQISSYLILPLIFIFFTLPSLVQGNEFIAVLLSFFGYIMIIILTTSSFVKFEHIESFLRIYFYALALLSFLIVMALLGYVDFGSYFNLPLVEMIWEIPRVLGTESNPNAFGVYYILGVILSINYFFLSESSSKKIIYLTITGLMLIVLLFTYSRSSMIAVAVSIVIYLYYKNSTRKHTELYWLFFLVAIFLGYMEYQYGSMPAFDQGVENLLRDKATSSGYRIQIIYQTIDIFLDNIFFGIGFNQLKAETVLRGLSLNQTTHSIYLAIAVEYGIFALIAFVLFLIVLTYRFILVIKRQKNDRIRSNYAAILGTFIGFLVNGLVHESYVNILMWVVIALMILVLIKNKKFEDAA